MPPAQGKRGYHAKGKREAPARVDPPCEHNDWDNVRIKKGNHSLRCRVCQSQWRVHHSFFSRCVPFLKGKCEHGARCQNVHLNQYKEGLSERRRRFGDTILTGVPDKILTSHGIEGAVEEKVTPPVFELYSGIPLIPTPLVLPNPVGGGEPFRRNPSNISIQSIVSHPSTNSLGMHSRTSTTSVPSPGPIVYHQAASSSTLSMQTVVHAATCHATNPPSPSPPATEHIDDNEGVMQLTDQDLDLMISNLEKRTQQPTHTFLPHTP